jgi:hypothetical protein
VLAYPRAPIGVQVFGNDQKANYTYAIGLLKRIRTVPGIRADPASVELQINVEVNRTPAGEVGLTQRRTAVSEAEFLVEYQERYFLSIVASRQHYRIDRNGANGPGVHAGVAPLTPMPTDYAHSENFDGCRF